MLQLCRKYKLNLCKADERTARLGTSHDAREVGPGSTLSIFPVTDAQDSSTT